MRRFLPVVYICVGFILGVFSSSFFSQKNSEKSSVAVVEQKTTCDTNPQDKQIPIETFPEDKNSSPITSQEIPNTCPKCPCLYSDKILGPPVFDPRLKEIIETNHEGEALIRWVEVPGAKRYAVHVETAEGKSVKVYKGSRSFIYLKDIPLPEGKFEANYFIRLGTVNGKDEEGPLGPRKQMYVKPQANVMAPAIQEIKVED